MYAWRRAWPHRAAWGALQRGSDLFSTRCLGKFTRCLGKFFPSRRVFTRWHLVLRCLTGGSLRRLERAAPSMAAAGVVRSWGGRALLGGLSRRRCGMRQASLWPGMACSRKNRGNRMPFVGFFSLSLNFCYQVGEKMANFAALCEKIYLTLRQRLILRTTYFEQR